MKQRRRVSFLTGTRADFGKLLPLLRVVDADSQFDCEIIATGMHLMNSYGYTLNEIYKAGFTKVFPIFNQDSTTSQKMDLALANTIIPLSHYFTERSPDLIVAHGDRVETLAAAIVASLNNGRIAHVEGGEVSGTVDESLRHAISKLANLHFVSNDNARSRLLQLGEEESSIHVIGSPEVDIMLGDSIPRIDDVKARYEIDFKDYSIVAYHPVTTERPLIGRHVDELFAAAEESGERFVVIRPNNDVGSEAVNRRIDQLKGNPCFRIFPSMRFEYYLALLRSAKCILGNSSSGVREAPVYGVPTINLGTRQQNRFNYRGIMNVPEQRELILKALAALPAQLKPILPFGDGRAAERFISIMRSEAIWNETLQKRFVDRAVAVNP